MTPPSGVRFSFFGSFEVGTGPYPISAIPFQEIVARAEAGVYQASPRGCSPSRRSPRRTGVMEAGRAGGKLVVTGA